MNPLRAPSPRTLGSLGLLLSLTILAVACGRTDLNLADEQGFGEGGSSGSGRTSSSVGPTSSSSSGGGPCSTPADCSDGGSCTTASCVAGECVFKPRDDDGDGHAPPNC